MTRNVIVKRSRVALMCVMLCACLVPSLALAQDGAMALQEDEVVAPAEAVSAEPLDSASAEWPARAVRRHEMISRRGEVAWQLESGLLLGYGAGFFSQGVVITAFPEEEVNPGAIYAGGVSTMIALGSSAAVYTAGRLNGSKADWKLVLLGGLAGAGINTLVTGVAGKVPWEGEPITRGLFTPALYAVLPVVGSVVGYQLSSSWRAGETDEVSGPATATSIYVLPTSQGVNAGLGFSF